MKCPACVHDNLKSKFFEQRPAPEKGEVERFFDEDGVRHVHDHTVYSIVMQCDRGHAYQRKLQSRCPAKDCEWNSRELVLNCDKKIGAP